MHFIHRIGIFNKAVCVCCRILEARKGTMWQGRDSNERLLLAVTKLLLDCKQSLFSSKTVGQNAKSVSMHVSVMCERAASSAGVRGLATSKTALVS